MGRQNVEAIYPLSPMQQGMLFHSLVTPETGVYVEQTTCTLRGPLDVPAFERAWQRVVDRHDILRTAFVWKRVEKLLQAVHRQVTIRLDQYDWRGLSEEDQDKEMRSLLRKDREQGFDLARPPLMRLALVRVSEDAYRFLWSHHHILLDGWSLPLLLREVLSLYGAFRQGRDLALPPARHYRDYINWLKQQDTSGDEAFWRRTLGGFSAATPLVVDQPEHATDPDQPRYRERARRLSLSETLALQAMARQHGLTLNTLVQGAWAVLLSRYAFSAEPASADKEDSGHDVVFGVTVSGRPPSLAGAEEMVGLFISTLPLRVRVRPDEPLIPWLKTLQARQAELGQYEHSPLAEVQRWSDLPAGQPLFESILVFENYPVEASLLRRSRDLLIEDIRSFEQTNYPLTVVGGLDSELVLKISYDGARFNQETIDRILGHWSTLLLGMLGDHSVVAEEQQKLSELPMLTQEELQQLLVAWNETAHREGDGYPTDEPCVHQWFEEQARKTPDAIAVTSHTRQAGSGISVTYGELNERADRLAHYLRARGVGPEVMVGLCMERSWEVLVGVLGVMKAGGAYVPMDPNYPVDRLAFMLQDSGVSLLLTQQRVVERLPKAGSARVICLDEDWEEIAREGASAGTDLPEVGPDNLAYVIYTSGSTGKPKGTLLEHRGLSNLIRYVASLMEVNAQSSVLQFASLSFDASVIDLFVVLTTGARLVMAPQEAMASVPDLLELLRREHITSATLPPALLRILPNDGLPDLRCVVSAGEACPPDVAARWAPGRLFLNGYGPTETTVAASYYRVQDVPEGTTHIPIGRPVDNVRLYVVDSNLQPVPIGVPGELCIGGMGVARGYLNRPELTSEKFVPDPFVPMLDGRSAPRMYRSGDLVRYREDGNLEFLGRIDHQVKIRGYRIEPGEVEAFLEQQEGIQQAAVIAHEEAPGDKRLLAYVVCEPNAAVTVAQLRDRARQLLPAYMAPSTFIILDQLPLTPNGKIDRKALANAAAGPAKSEAQGSSGAGQSNYVAPRTPVEGVLVGIFEQVLSAEHVGIHDNFFELGGHSLLATQAASRLRNVLDVDLPLQHLFEAPTVAALAERVEAVLKSGADKAPPILPRGAAPDAPNSAMLSFSQERLWFLDQLAPGNLYNIPIAVKLSGVLDQAALAASLHEIVRRHEILRTTFRAVRGMPVQESTTEFEIPLPVTDLTGLPRPERETEARRLVQEQASMSFDLARGPLLRAQLLKLGKEEHVVLLVFHHIVFDGWSADVFLGELATLYAAYVDHPVKEEGGPGAERQRAERSPLADLDIQYADFAQWQRSWLQGEVLEKQLSYWRGVLSPLPPTLDLPTDHPRPAVQSWRGGAEDFEFSPDLLKRLQDVGRAEGATLFMTLLATFQVLLYRYTGQEDLSIGSPIANRHHPGIEKLIGFFVNTLVLRTDLSGGPTFRQLLQRVRKVALEAYAHQDVPFEMLVEKLHPQRDLSHNPLFQVAFTVQHTAPQYGTQQAAASSPGLQGITMTPWPVDGGTAKFDLTLIFDEGPQGLSGTLEYNRDLFDAPTIRRMIGHLRTLLEEVARDVTQPIATLNLLTPAERQQILVEWNRTRMPTPADRCAHQLFEEHAARQPRATAVTFEDQSLTYGELDQRANQLAHYLRELGVGPEVLVGILTERSLEMVVGILGTMKAGGAYLPLDPAYPAERLAFMLQDARVPVLLTLSRLAQEIPALMQQATQGNPSSGAGAVALQTAGSAPLHIVRLDEDWPLIARHGAGAKSAQPPSTSVTPDNLAYVIYTSGSTGRPKGTMLCHRGLSNLAEVQRQAFDIRPSSRVLQFSSLSFDASVWETFMALANGGTLCLARQEVLASGVELARLLREQGITHATLPPSVLRVLPAHTEGQAGRPPSSVEFPDLQYVIAAGEACSVDLVARWAPGRRFFNAYGPTETTVCASMHLCDPSSPEPPPIGRPIGNFRLYVLDQNKQPTAVGVPGELYIGGIGLARGYLNRPELTAERFVPDPFSRRVGSRLYRTGDLVRYLPDGSIDFLGRIDQQVKIRGFRIELGEIEAVLREHPGVLEAAVAPKEMGSEGLKSQRLVAYVVAKDKPGPDSGELRALLRQRLPEYMVPSAFVSLDALPLMPNGKVDRRALPDPQAGSGADARMYIAPRTPMEQTLATLWGELLGVEQVGADDNFFDLGGHSLLATQLVSRLQETVHVELPVRALFEAPVLSQLAQQIDALQASRSNELESIMQALQQVQSLSENDVQWMLGDKPAHALDSAADAPARQETTERAPDPADEKVQDRYSGQYPG